jgi:hypothetical protein
MCHLGLIDFFDGLAPSSARRAIRCGSPLISLTREPLHEISTEVS